MDFFEVFFSYFEWSCDALIFLCFFFPFFFFYGVGFMVIACLGDLMISYTFYKRWVAFTICICWNQKQLIKLVSFFSFCLFAISLICILFLSFHVWQTLLNPIFYTLCHPMVRHFFANLLQSMINQDLRFYPWLFWLSRYDERFGSCKWSPHE